MGALGVTSKLGAGALYNVFLLAGAIVGLLVIDRISRRFFLISTVLAGGGLLAGLAFLSHLSPVLAIVLFTAFAFVLAAAVNLEFVYPPELFPTDPAGLRCRGRRRGQPDRLGRQHLPAPGCRQRLRDGGWWR